MLDFVLISPASHSRGNGISGAHNRFTHYPCPVTKAIKIYSGSNGIISNMVPTLQHLYTVSMLIGKVEYVPRRNRYDNAQEKTNSENIALLRVVILVSSLGEHHSDVEIKWQRLRSSADRHYLYSSAQTDLELEEPEGDATPEQSKSAFYYMFNRVYNQWEEATLTEKEEHEAIINFKNSTKIPR